MASFAEIRLALIKDINRLRVQEGYLRAGLPLFPGLFGRDSLIAAWQMLRHDPGIAKHTLVRLATLQGRKQDLRREEEPGKILHEYYEPRQIHARLILKPRVTFAWGLPYYGSVDATPLWLIVFGEYVARTDDTKLLEKFYPNVVHAAFWLQDFADSNKDGFIDYKRHSTVGLVSQAWKDSDELGDIVEPVAVVEAQGYAYAAWQAVSRLAMLQNDRTLSESALRAADDLRNRFLSAFLMPDNFFAYALNGDGAQVAWRTSNPGHLLFSGILDIAAADAIVQRLFADDFWTPYGIRTLSTREPGFDWQSYHKGAVWPHDNWFVWCGLKRLGRYKEANRIRDALIAAWEQFGGKLPELYGVSSKGDLSLEIYVNKRTKLQRPNPLQAWASGALFSMLEKEHHHSSIL